MRGRIVISRLTAERVAHPMRGSDELRSVSTIAKRAPDLTDHDIQVGVGHEGVGPDCLEQVLLRHNSRPAREKQTEHVERLTRQVHLAPILLKLPRGSVDDE